MMVRDCVGDFSGVSPQNLDDDSDNMMLKKGSSINGETKLFLPGVTDSDYEGDVAGGTCNTEDVYLDDEDEDEHDDDEGYAAELLPHPDELIRDTPSSKRRGFRSHRNSNGMYYYPDKFRRQQQQQLQPPGRSCLVCACACAAVTAVVCLAVGLSFRFADNNGHPGKRRGWKNDWRSEGTTTANETDLTPPIPSPAPTAATRDIALVPRGQNWKQLGEDLIGQHPYGAFGYSVSLSLNGNRMAIGSPFSRFALDTLHLASPTEEKEMKFHGFAKVYNWDSDAKMWVSTGNEIGNAKDGYYRTGDTISLSADGHRVGVASVSPGGSEFNVYQDDRTTDLPQSVWLPVGVLFTVDSPISTNRNTSNLNKQANSATDTNWKDGQHFVMSPGGKHIAMGGMEGGRPARVLREEGNEWRPMGSPLEELSETNDPNNHNSIRHVALSYKGHRVAVSSPGCPASQQQQQQQQNAHDGTTQVAHNRGTLQVYSFSKSKNDWMPLGAPLEGLDNYCSVLSAGVALSGNGKVLAASKVVRSLNGTAIASYVKIFRYDHAYEEWLPWGRDVFVATVQEDLGFAISLSHTGYRLAVGTVQFHRLTPPHATFGGGKTYHEYLHRGVVQIYQFGRWTHEDTDRDANWLLVGDRILGKLNGDMAGWSVSLAGDGSRVAIGAPYNDISDKLTQGGHVRVYQLETGP